jgi:hypothetical protein
MQDVMQKETFYLLQRAWPSQESAVLLKQTTTHLAQGEQLSIRTSQMAALEVGNIIPRSNPPFRG